jgi:hypothetical protein
MYNDTKVTVTLDARSLNTILLAMLRDEKYPATDAVREYNQTVRNRLLKAERECFAVDFGKTDPRLFATGAVRPEYSGTFTIEPRGEVTMPKTKRLTRQQKADSPHYSACAHCTEWVKAGEGVRVDGKYGEEVFCDGKCAMQSFNEKGE